MCWSKVCSEELWYILSGLNIWLDQSENDNPARQNWFKVTRHDKPYTIFYIDLFELMAWWLRQVAVSQATRVPFTHVTESLCCPKAILRGIEPDASARQWAEQRAYIYCSIIFSLEFRQQWSRAHKDFYSLNDKFTSTVLEHLKCGQAPGLCHVWSFIFSWTIKNNEKTVAHAEGFQPSSPVITTVPLTECDSLSRSLACHCSASWLSVEPVVALDSLLY